MFRDFDYDPFLLVRPGNERRGGTSSSAALYPSRMMWLSPNTDRLIQSLLRDEEQEMTPKRQQRSNNWIENDFLSSLMRPGFNSEQIQNVREIAGVAKDDWASVVDSRGFNPDKVNIQLDGNTLRMSGNSEWKSSDGTHKRSRTFSQAFTLPEDVKLDTLQTKMLDNGSMVVHAEREKKEEKKKAVRDIPIQRIENKAATENNAVKNKQKEAGEE